MGSLQLRDQSEMTGRTSITRVPRAGPLRGPGPLTGSGWRQAYVRRAVVGDGMCAAAGAAVGYAIRFGRTDLAGPKAAFWIALTLPVVWVAAMHFARSYEQRFLWAGPEEYRRVFSAAILLVAALGTMSWAVKLEVARGFVVLALPLALLLTLVQRYQHRQWLRRQRGRGRFQHTTLLVGHPGAVAALDQQMSREAFHGYRVIGCCLPGLPSSADPDQLAGVRVLGGVDDVPAVVSRYQVETVAVLPCPELGGPSLRRLGWALEDTAAELLVAPAITEIVGPRICIRPVCGLPLLHMERPELHGVRRLTKDLFDRCGAALLLLLLLPVALVTALAVVTTSPGPVFFRQERIGRGGRPFSMLKFRTMVSGAERMAELLADGNDGNGVLFKLRDDPRLTRPGRALRRYSLDELPQLVNVLRGEMSLVGPRPPLREEVERYGDEMYRRFLVKPGITGLWQISGRADLTWDESVRMDLRYVENWSLAGDFAILWRTLGAVLRGAGAY